MPKIFFILLFSFTFYYLNGQAKIISTGEDWYYYDGKDSLPSSWYFEKNISNKWKKGVSPLGYGSRFVKTNISYGSNPDNKDITKFFKKKFFVEDPYQYLIYSLNVQRDDGIIVYLNGNEVMRSNMPFGVITDTTKANDLVFRQNELITHTKLLSPDDLISGLNVISASVHQARASSSDCVFNLELIGSNQSEMIPLLLKEQTIKNLNLDIKLKELSHKQEVEKKNFQIEQTENSNKIFKLLVYGLLAALVTLLIVFFYFWKNARNNEMKLTTNTTKLEKISKSKDQEMMNLSLNALHNKQLLKDIKRDVDDIIKDHSNNKYLKQVASKIDYNLEFEDEWENLKKHFNEVHSGFVNRLIAKYTSLTDIELRHCIFIKLHMQTKEIANILHIDPRSVQAARYRIKKKMDLEEGVDLRDYLLNI